MWNKLNPVVQSGRWFEGSEVLVLAVSWDNTNFMASCPNPYRLSHVAILPTSQSTTPPSRLDPCSLVFMTDEEVSFWASYSGAQNYPVQRDEEADKAIF